MYVIKKTYCSFTAPLHPQEAYHLKKDKHLFTPHPRLTHTIKKENVEKSL